MHIVCYMLDSIGEFLSIYNYVSIISTLHMSPAIVNVDIFVAKSIKTKVNECVSYFFYDLFRNVECEIVPGIEPHGRC